VLGINKFIYSLLSELRGGVTSLLGITSGSRFLFLSFFKCFLSIGLLLLGGSLLGSGCVTGSLGGGGGGLVSFLLGGGFIGGLLVGGSLIVRFRGFLLLFLLLSRGRSSGLISRSTSSRGRSSGLISRSTSSRGRSSGLISTSSSSRSSSSRRSRRLWVVHVVDGGESGSEGLVESIKGALGSSEGHGTWLVLVGQSISTKQSNVRMKTTLVIAIILT